MFVAHSGAFARIGRAIAEWPPSLRLRWGFDQAKVVRLHDRLSSLQPGEQVAIDQILMLLLGSCVLGERFALAA
jgi:hypothetical protein